MVLKEGAVVQSLFKDNPKNQATLVLKKGTVGQSLNPSLKTALKIKQLWSEKRVQ